MNSTIIPKLPEITGDFFLNFYLLCIQDFFKLSFKVPQQPRRHFTYCKVIKVIIAKNTTIILLF